MNEKKDALYLECYSGISGDMVTAALLDLGADEVVLRKALASLPLDGFSINISRVKKAGLDACDFDVVLDAEHENHDHDTFASGIAAQNAMLTTLSTLLRTRVKTPETAKAAKDISLRRKPVYQGDLDDIEMYFMAAVKEIKKGIGSHYAEQEAMSKKVAEKMFTELTKGQDVQHPTITAEQLTDAMLDSVSGMEGATPEALEQLRNGLLGILQSAAEQENAHEADE